MTMETPVSQPVTQTSACCGPDSPSGCCTEGAAPSAKAAAEDLYQQFLATAGRPGNLDAFTKQAIQIALSVATRCEPCLKAHMQKARQNGFTPAEMDEAAMLGVAFGGSPALVMYARAKNSK